MSDFASFLDQMDNEVGHKPKPKKTVPTPVVEEEVVEASFIEEDYNDYVEPEPEYIAREEDDSEEEDVVERILTFTSIIMKSIRENFPNKQHKQMAYESVSNAINMATGKKVNTVVGIVKNEPIPVPVSAMTGGKSIYDFKEGQQINLNQSYVPDNITEIETQDINKVKADKPIINESKEYKSGMNVQMKMGNDGKPEVDMSSMSPQDMADMRAIAGIG